MSKLPDILIQARANPRLPSNFLLPLLMRREVNHAFFLFFSHWSFRFLLVLLARVSGADLPGGGSGSRGIVFSSVLMAGLSVLLKCIHNSLFTLLSLRFIYSFNIFIVVVIFVYLCIFTILFITLYCAKYVLYFSCNT